VLSHLEQFDAAITSYEHAIALQPDFASAWYDKACCLIMQDKQQEAIALLETAFRLNPSLKQHATTDSSLDPVRPNPQFQQLLASGN
jgi:tetratricopeptide (TPR) repeat protein